MRSDIPTTTTTTTTPEASTSDPITRPITAVIALDAIIVGTGIGVALATIGITAWAAVIIGLLFTITDYTLTRACTTAAATTPPRRRLPIYLTAGLFAAVTALIIGPAITLAAFATSIDTTIRADRITEATTTLDEATTIRDSRYADWQAELLGARGSGQAGNGPEAQRLQQLYEQANVAVADQQQALGQAQTQTPSPSLAERYTTLTTQPYAWITMVLITAIIFLLGITPVLLTATTRTPATTEETP